MLFERCKAVSFFRFLHSRCDHGTGCHRRALDIFRRRFVKSIPRRVSRQTDSLKETLGVEIFAKNVGFDTASDEICVINVGSPLVRMKPSTNELTSVMVPLKLDGKPMSPNPEPASGRWRSKSAPSSRSTAPAPSPPSAARRVAGPY